MSAMHRHDDEIREGDVTLTPAEGEFLIVFADDVSRSEKEAFMHAHGLTRETWPDYDESAGEGTIDAYNACNSEKRMWIRRSPYDEESAEWGEEGWADRRVIERTYQVYGNKELPYKTGFIVENDEILLEIPSSVPEGEDLVTALNEEVFHTPVGEAVIRFVDEIELERGKTRLLTVQLTHPELHNPLQIAKQLESSSYVLSTSVNWLQLHDSIDIALHVPDLFYSQQWNLKKIRVEEAWKVTQGSADVVVAVIDTGCDLDHEDLAMQYVPVNDRYDCEDGDHYPKPKPMPKDIHFHGTACAGVVGAYLSTKGVVGVAPGSKILPIRVLLDRGSVESKTCKAIAWARDHKARVVSMSWHWDGPRVRLEKILTDAHNAGVVLVAAAGNRANKPGYEAGYINFPASHEHVIAVGASDENDDHCAFSQYGPKLSVVAPGTRIWTTDIAGADGRNKGGATDKGDIQGHYYNSFGGTSAATPHVAGLAALILSVKPNLSPDDVRDIIEKSADNPTPGHHDQQVGWGRINAGKAVELAKYR